VYRLPLVVPWTKNPVWSIVCTHTDRTVGEILRSG